MTNVGENEYDKVMKLIDDKQYVSEYLMGNHDTCNMFGKELKIVKYLGGGAYGTTFLVEFKNGDKKTYVLKNINLETYSINRKLGKAHETRVRSSEKYLSTPKYIKYPKHVRRTTPSNYVYDNGNISEYILYMECSKLTKYNISPHFIEVGSFSHCKKGVSPKVLKPVQKPYNSTIQFFMEAMDGVVEDNIKCFNPFSFYIQGLHAIDSMHNIGISHNDLNAGNIMYKAIDETTTWKGKRMMDYDYFCYKLRAGTKTKNVYIPFSPYLLKIIDFGLSMQYKDDGVVIGNKDVYEDKLAGVYNKFYDSYDYVYLTYVTSTIFKEAKFMNEKFLKDTKISYMGIEAYELGRINKFKELNYDYTSLLPKEYLQKPKGTILYI